LYTFLYSLIRATCSANLIRLDLICLMIFGNEFNYEAPHCATSSIFPSLQAFLISAVDGGEW
jgi:hypothetical protein